MPAAILLISDRLLNHPVNCRRASMKTLNIYLLAFGLQSTDRVPSGKRSLVTIWQLALIPELGRLILLIHHSVHL